MMLTNNLVYILVFLLTISPISLYAADKAHITISINKTWLKGLLNIWACSRVGCEGKTDSQIAYDAINKFMKEKSEGFKAWNLDDLGATVNITYEDE